LREHRRSSGSIPSHLIIGTGPGRGTLAYKLALLGKTILLLEDWAEK
jgi:choline dehydrogenase-like flavoprotein